MASYTSSQNGNWSDANTWGGGGYPNLANDNATISANHVVTYDLNSTTELGNVTISGNGTLQMSTTMNTTIHFGNGVNLQTSNNGSFLIGNNTTCLNKAYTCCIGFNTLTNNNNGFIVGSTAGTVIGIYGDPGIYGGGANDDRAILANNLAANSSNVFTIAGNYVGKWSNGQEIYINRHAQYSTNSHLSNTKKFTIANIAANAGNTDITVVEAAPTTNFNAGGVVINADRNIKIYKIAGDNNCGDGANHYGSNMFRMQLGLNGIQVLSNALVTGAYGVVGGNNATLTDVIVRNGYAYLTNNGSVWNGVITRGATISTNFGIVGFATSIVDDWWATATSTSSGYLLGLINYKRISNVKIFSCNQVMSGTMPTGSSLMNPITGDIYDCQYALGGNGAMHHPSCYFNMNVFWCQYAASGSGVMVGGRMGYDSNGEEKLNIYDYLYTVGTQFSEMLMIGTKINIGEFSVASRGSSYRAGCVFFENYQQVQGSHRILACMGDVYNVAANGVGVVPNARSGGANEILQIDPNSTALNNACPVPVILSHTVTQNAGNRTYRYYVQTNYNANIPAGGMILYATHLNDANNGTVAVAYNNTAVITERGNQNDWSQYIEVPVTQAANGVVHLRLELCAANGSNQVWVDPEVYVY